MPRRNDIKKILIIGSGRIVIGQACEFDYSGTQAVKALKEEGFEVVLVNSNPATIMTDPELAHRTYIEPITPEIVAKIIEAERPDALLPTLGGQTGAEHRRVFGGDGRAGQVQGQADRRERGGDQEGRGPRAVQGRHEKNRPGAARSPGWPPPSSRPGRRSRRSATP